MINIPNIQSEVQLEDGAEVIIPQLIVKPEAAQLCTTSSLTLTSFIRSESGEVKLNSGVTYTSSNTAVLTVNATTGVATIIGAGRTIVKAAWQNQIAYSSISILSSGSGCCAQLKVAYEILIDNSLSMSSHFNNDKPTKFEASRKIAGDFIAGLNITKDILGLMTFSTFASEVEPIGTTQVYEGIYSLNLTEAFTSFLPSLNSAFANLSAETSDLQVAVIFSDGENIPKMKNSDSYALSTAIDAFKENGGIVVVCGLRAHGKGFDFLQKIASAGYFVNVYGDGSSVISNAVTALQSMLGFFCGGATATNVAAQTPDPFPLFNPESKGIVPRYASTKSFCVTVSGSACCKSAMAFSDLSQEEADSKAMAKAMAISARDCV